MSTTSMGTRFDLAIRAPVKNHTNAVCTNPSCIQTPSNADPNVVYVSEITHPTLPHIFDLLCTQGLKPAF